MSPSPREKGVKAGATCSLRLCQQLRPPAALTHVSTKGLGCLLSFWHHRFAALAHAAISITQSSLHRR